MSIWLETIAVILLALSGAIIGWFFSRLGRPWWLLGYILPLALILMIALARNFPVLNFTPPFSWLVVGRLEFALLGPIITCIFGSLASRLKRRLNILFLIFIIIVVSHQSFAPFIAPALTYHRVINLDGMTEFGYCLQSTDYTCGPAAAVSALYQLGIKAKEGRIAVNAFTSSFSGTSPDLLCRAINKLYADQGVTSTYRLLNSLEELKLAGLTIVIVKYSPLVDHYITVLEVTDDEVITLDPLVGRRVLNHQRFLQLWRRSGITLKKI